MFTDPVSGEQKSGIVKVRYSHDAMIDLMIAQPTLKQNDLAAMFDRSPAWISSVINSDSFQARYEERRKTLVDPTLVNSIGERLRAVADASLERLHDKLTGVGAAFLDAEFLVKSAKLATDALGYGARPVGNTTNVAVVVQVPGKITNAAEWAAAHRPAPLVQEV
jgi:hypothetical protein